MIRAIIVDDETKSRETIFQMVSIYCKNVEVVAQAYDVRSGIIAIRRHNPELVLLDIRMPDGSGFDLLRQIGKIDFKVIFVTAFEEYAIKAFKFSAIDYVLKPIDPDELVKAIEKSKELLDKANIQKRLNALLENIDQSKKTFQGKKLILKTSDNIYLVETDEIIRIEADGNYCTFYLIGGQRIVVSRTLKEYDEALQNLGFFRIHQTHVVNLNLIKRYNKEENQIYMCDSSVVPVSHRKKDELMGLFNTETL